MADRPHVLIVDDDVSLAENVAEILEALDVETEVVARAGDALAQVGRRRFDLVLVDVRLPDGDGTALVAPIREQSPHTEVVLITGDATVDSAVTAVSIGAFAYVLKPFSPPDLLDVARRALAQVAHGRERERLQQELQQSERRHREVIEAIPAFVLALDEQGRIAFWNRQLEKATGFPRAEMLGTPGEVLVGGGGVRQVPTRAGSHLLVRWQRATVAIAGGEPTLSYAVGADVTGEQEMLRRALRAERLAAVGTLAAGLAHEVRNPLNSAALQLQVLRRRMERDDVSRESINPVVELVEEEIRRLERLVNDFLSFARPRPLELQQAALADICHSIVTLMEPEARASQVELQLDVAEELPPVHLDPERLRQVLQNLLRNAIEAMPQGGRATIRVRRAAAMEPGAAEVREQGIEIDIEDTGPGFQEDSPVFDAFFTTKPKGTGLGLSIVHRIVSDHGGTLRVRSRPGETCFTIFLPAGAAA
jgi:signal transduction histidine kinase